MRAIDKESARKELLWSGYEDWTGLWEAVWWFQTEYPELRGDPARNQARRFLKELVAEGLVRLCFLDESTNMETPIEREKALEIMSKDESWSTPDRLEHQVRYVTTEAGSKLLFKGAEASS